MKKLPILTFLFLIANFNLRANDRSSEVIERVIVHKSQERAMKLEEQALEDAAAELIINKKIGMKKPIEDIETDPIINTEQENPIQYFSEHVMSEGESIFGLMKKNGFDIKNKDLIETVYFYNGINAKSAAKIPIGGIILLPAKSPEAKIISKVVYKDSVNTSQASISSINARPSAKRKYNTEIFIGARRYSITEDQKTLEQDVSDLFGGARFNHGKFTYVLLKEGALNNKKSEFDQSKTSLRASYKFLENQKLKGISALITKDIFKYNITSLNLSTDLTEIKTDLTSIGLSIDFKLPSERFNLQLNVTKPFITNGESSSDVFGREITVESNIFLEAIVSLNINESFSLFTIVSHQKENFVFEQSDAELQMSTVISKIGIQYGF